MMESLHKTKLALFEMRQRQPQDGPSIVSSRTPSPYELEHMYRDPGELDSQSPQIYEAAATDEVSNQIIRELGSVR